MVTVIQINFNIDSTLRVFTHNDVFEVGPHSNYSTTNPVFRLITNHINKLGVTCDHLLP